MITAIVIDDEHDITEVFCEFLEIKGVKVVGIGHDGKKAIELYKKFKPSVVLMDLVMSNYDGFYALQKIREYDPDSKVIIFSASLTPEYVEQLKKMNVSGITRKPYDMDKVIGLIEKVTEGKIIDLTE